MGRITLTVAHSDKEFLDSLAYFLIDNYSHRFQVTTLLRIDKFKNYIAKSVKKADILLVEHEIYNELDDKIPADTIIILTEDHDEKEYKGQKAVYKYQHADKLVSEIMGIFSDNANHRSSYASTNKKTVITAVYSPTGGSGKTSIALGCCILSSVENISAFYLNLEDIPSTGYFEDNSSQHNFSDIMFELKEPKDNFSLKMEMARSIHPEYGIYCFPTADSVREIKALSGEEIDFLISQFKASGQYDAVFIDMSCGLSEMNTALLEACDEIIMPLNCDKTSRCKTEAFINELRIIYKEDKPYIIEKITPVINKYRGVPESLILFPNPVSAKIPYIQELEHCGDIRSAVINNIEFANNLAELLKKCKVMQGVGNT